MGTSLRQAAAAAAVSTCLVLAVGAVAYTIWGIHPTYGTPSEFPTWGSFGEALGAVPVRWDAKHYIEIAENGYTDSIQPAWFPLYPLLAAALGAIVGSVAVGGFLVSLAAFVVGLTLLHKLTALELGPEAASRVVWLTALFPSAIFFPSILTESLFFALSVGAVYAARLGRWEVAALVGGAAALTRNTGVLLLLPIAALYLYGPREGGRPAAPLQRLRGRLRALSPRFRVERDFAWLLAIPLGLGVYLAYSWIEFSDPLATMHAQDYWNRGFHGPLSAVFFATQDAWYDLKGLKRFGIDWANIFTYDSPTYWGLRRIGELSWIAFAGVALVGAFRRLPPAYGLYAAAGLAVPLTYPDPVNPLASFNRYLLVLFPLYMWLAAATERRSRYAAVLVVSVLGLIFQAVQVANGRWV